MGQEGCFGNVDPGLNLDGGGVSKFSTLQGYKDIPRRILSGTLKL